MSEETKCEIIKAFAYGLTPEEIAQVEGITEAEAAVFQSENETEIAERKALLTEEGWI